MAHHHHQQQHPQQQQQQQQQQPQTSSNMAGVGVPVPYPMASIVPFPLAYSFLPAPAGGVVPGVGVGVSAPNAAFSYAPPIPGLQYFPSAVAPPMPLAALRGPAPPQQQVTPASDQYLGTDIRLGSLGQLFQVDLFLVIRTNFPPRIF